MISREMVIKAMSIRTPTYVSNKFTNGLEINPPTTPPLPDKVMSTSDRLETKNNKPPIE